MTDDNFDLSRRKALAGLGTIGVATAGAGAGTFAYFSDTESSTGNQIQAGTLDLEVGSSDSLDIDVTDEAPGWSSSYSASIDNVGSIEGGLRLEVNVTDTSEGDDPESETSYDQSNGMRDEVWIRAGFGGYGVIDTATSLGTAEMLGELDALRRLSGGGSTTLDVEVGIDADATNEIQGDSITFEIVVSLLQKEPITVGSSGDYSSIQTAVDEASFGDTVKLLDSSYTISPSQDTSPSEGVKITSPGINLYGDGATLDVGGAGRGVVVDADDVTVNGIEVTNAHQGLEVNADSDNNDSRKSGVALMDLTIDGGADDRSIVVDYSDEVVINDVTTSNNVGSGLELWYANDSRVENVTADNNDDNGIYFNGDGNELLHSEASGNADEGLDVSWYDDIGPDQQRVLVDGVTLSNNSTGSGGDEDIELHDDGGGDTAADDSKLLKNVETAGSPPGTGLLLVQVADSEVQLVNCNFPNGTDSGDGTDVDPN